MSYRYDREMTPPPAERASPVAITRFAHVFEVDPALMTEHVLQQVFPNWDTLRLVRSRADHLAWMHRHFAHTVISGEELLDDLD
ncbi:hypothetical protein [Nonomuraea soli]|uniref:Uncharacterized protein n=1 Tax=Nonomuraea soli TaxID=1032476 RepID=A0A7W0HV11_9ACTN|nr:hypothetical protein [Nonomuraea soli]MBA2896306.1 hypothetical protein [Nonomuraea soli]